MVSKGRYSKMAAQEMRFLRVVRNGEGENRERVVQLLDDFKLSGVNGEHRVLVFETLGPNLDKWLADVCQTYL